MAGEQTKPQKSPRKWWLKKRWWTLVLFILALVWLDGPGWRWIATKAADRYLPRLGLEGGFDLSGRLSGGSIGIRKLDLGGDAVLRVVRFEKAEVNYRLGNIFKGRIESIVISGLVAEVELDASGDGAEDEKDDSKPSRNPAETLRSLRERIVPVEIDLREVSVRVTRGGELVYSIEPTTILHPSGDDSFSLELGAMEFPGGRRVEAQSTRLFWEPSSLRLATLEVMPGLGIRDLVADHPAGETPDFSGGILLDGVRFDLATDLETATVTQQDSPLPLHDAARIFDLELPARATLDRLSITARNLSGGLETLEADLELGASAIDYDGWSSSGLSLAAALEGEQLRATLQGEALGSPVDLRSEALLDRSNQLLPKSAKIDFTVPQLENALTVVRDRFIPPAGTAPDELPAPRPALPPSLLKGTASARFEQGKPLDATTELSITGPGEAPPLDLTASWSPADGLAATLITPGLRAEGGFNPGLQSYQGAAALDGFSPESLAPWLAPFGIEAPAGITTSLSWRGSGLLEQKNHQGELELGALEWIRTEREAPFKAYATASYSWPEKLSLTPLNVQQAAQKVEGDLILEDRILTLNRLAWSDGDDILFNGTASIPVPDDPTDWRALLRQDRPIDIDLQSTELPLAKLHPFLPETTRFQEAGRGRLSLKLTGTPADPLLDATLDVREFGLASQANLPPVNIELEAVGKDQTLKLEGSVTAEGFPPANLIAITNWSPDQWAEDPATLKAAKLDASTRIENLNLTLFSDFVPQARRLEGMVNINLEATGTVGEPEALGTVTLEGGRYEMDDPTIPRVRNLNLKLTANPDTVTLENLTGMVSGGTIAIRGGVELDEGKPSAIDLAIEGRALPARRDSSMIVRVNTDLAVRGPWETATVSGTIGIIDSLFFRDIEILPIGVPFNQPSEPSLPSVDAPAAADLTAAVPEPFRSWGLDLKLRSAMPFLIRGNLASGEVFLNVDVGGTIARPRPTGEATLREISAKLPFSTLRIDSGLVRFRPDNPFDPVLDIRARSTIRPYEIEFFVYGPISDPQILPNSNPPLPDTEIMTLVATGTTTAGFEDPQAATARAAQLLIEEIRRGRISKVRGLRPVLALLDRVDFQVGEKDPFSSARFNSATINIDDNWLVRAGLSEEGTTRTTLIYLFRFR